MANEKTLWDRVEALETAKGKLEEAIELIRDALAGTQYERHADAYLVAHLRSWIDEDNRINYGCQQYIEKLECEWQRCEVCGAVQEDCCCDEEEKLLDAQEKDAETRQQEETLRGVADAMLAATDQLCNGFEPERKHDCDENAQLIDTDGPLGHGWECAICGKFLQAG